MRFLHKGKVVMQSDLDAETIIWLEPEEQTLGKERAELVQREQLGDSQ